jgi:hypothetical protein
MNLKQAEYAKTLKDAQEIIGNYLKTYFIFDTEVETIISVTIETVKSPIDIQ